MKTNELHELAAKLPAGAIIGVVGFIGFLCGSKPSAHLREAMERLYDEDYEVADRSADFDPWEVDAMEARAHLHLLVDMVTEADRYAAARYLQYALDGSFPGLPEMEDPGV
jgi:hypothetical protein